MAILQRWVYDAKIIIYSLTTKFLREYLKTDFYLSLPTGIHKKKWCPSNGHHLVKLNRDLLYEYVKEKLSQIRGETN